MSISPTQASVAQAALETRSKILTAVNQILTEDRLDMRSRESQALCNLAVAAGVAGRIDTLLI